MAAQAVEPEVKAGGVSPLDTRPGGAANGVKRDGPLASSKGGDPPAVDLEAATDAAPPISVSYFGLFRYAQGMDWLFIALGTLGAVGNGCGMPIFATILGSIMNDFGFNQDNPEALTDKVNSAVPYFIYLGVGTCIGAYCQGFFWAAASVRQVNRMRAAYLHSVLRQDVAFFDTTGTSGRLLQGLNEDCITIQSAIGDKVAMFLFQMTTAVAGIIIAFIRGWDMTLVLLSLLPLLAGAGYAISVVIGRMTATMNKAYADANSVAQQALGNVRTVYAFNGEERTVQDFDNSLQGPLRVGIKSGFLAGTTIGLTNCVAFCAYALSMWYGAERVADGAYTGGQVLNVLFAALIGGFALGQAAPNVQYFQQGTVAAGRLFGILNRKPGIDSEAGGSEIKEVQGAVELRNVSFCYPARPDKRVFSDFSLTVPAGKTVALVGESGSGKSTVVSLIERYYDPQAGSVRLDGVDIRTLDLHFLRRQLGLVSQEPTLFATSILDNIKYGRPGASQAEVEQAARSANAHAFISGLPQGYATHVGEKGVQMSGGQKQRIAIARAILKDPRVLLLDEATSALDAQSEHVVQEALDRLMVGRTTVVVAHRLSTVRDADAIAVVKDGKIVEQGSHEELQAAGGTYATLIQMQSSEPEGDPNTRRASMDAPMAWSGSAEHADAASKALETVLETRAALVASPTKVKVAPPGLGPRTYSKWGRFISFQRKTPEERAAAKPEAAKPVEAEDEEEKPHKVTWKRLAQLNKPELPAIVGGLLGSAGLGMLFPAFALALSSLIVVYYYPDPAEVRSGASKWAGIFAGIGFGAFISALLQSYSFNYMGQRLAYRVRVMMMRALLRQEVGWYDQEKNSSGVLTSKLSADALAVKGQFGDTMGLLTQNLVTIVAGYIIAGINSWRMMLVVTAAVPLIGVAAVVQTQLMLAYSSKEEETFARANQTASEAFTSIRTIAAFGMEHQVGKLYADKLRQPTAESQKRANWAGLGFGFSQLVLFGIYALAFWYMALEISRGQSTFEQALKAFFAIFLAAFGAAQAQVYFPDVAKGKAATQRVFRVIDRQPLIDASDPGGERPVECSGAIELRGVTFAYPQRPEAPVFTDFSLTVPAGKTVALVGQSGSGKSSVISLIERFYDPQAGAVLLDGVDVRSLNLHWLRSQVGLVSQEPVLFNMTVADNIKYGRPEASAEAVEAAAKAANAHAFIEALPEGYATMLGEGSIQLSGGQKQRIAIARAVVKDPRLLLLDEATSALDAESEHVVQEALDRLMVGRTTVVVAHRLSTVRDADAIAVVYQGRIVEQGTHRQLVAAAGAYARLVRHQMARA